MCWPRWGPGSGPPRAPGCPAESPACQAWASGERPAATWPSTASIPAGVAPGLGAAAVPRGTRSLTLAGLSRTAGVGGQDGHQQAPWVSSVTLGWAGLSLGGASCCVGAQPTRVSSVREERGRPQVPTAFAASGLAGGGCSGHAGSTLHCLASPSVQAPAPESQAPGAPGTADVKTGSCPWKVGLGLSVAEACPPASRGPVLQWVSWRGQPRRKCGLPGSLCLSLPSSAAGHWPQAGFPGA